MTTKNTATLSACLTMVLLGGPTLAWGGELVPEALRAKVAAKGKKTNKRHKTKMTLGATGSANSSSNVVGAVDGTTVQLGLVVQGSHTFNAGPHVVETEGKIQHAQSRTPALDAFVKSADVFELQSTWLYRAGDETKFGPFARARLATQLIGSVDVRPIAGSVKRTDVDGKESTQQVSAEEATPTTGAFEPLLVNQTVGVFANPLKGPKLKLKLKAGAGAQQIITQGGYTVTGYDADTATLSLKQLETSVQAGGEIEVQASGALSKTVAWTAKAKLFQPLYSNAQAKFSGLDALQTDVAGTVSVKLSSWAKLDYVVNVRRIPLVLDDWQVQHGLLLTTGFNLL